MNGKSFKKSEVFENIFRLIDPAARRRRESNHYNRSGTPDETTGGLPAVPDFRSGQMLTIGQQSLCASILRP
jgi:hypothetical protein